MQKAFSLVELSIVLVILGLLTGGILAGQSLIRAAELRSIVTEFQRFVAATNTFRDKYMALPGDMPNATRFWGRLNSNSDCRTASAAAVATPGACDGNGNGSVFPNGTSWAATTSQEQFQAWRHLALAGFIEGNYSGISGPTDFRDVIVGTNVPRGRVGNSHWSFIDWNNTVGGNAVAYAIDYNRGFNISSILDWRILTPSEAWNIDIKLDDGKPARGNVIALGYNDTCASADIGVSTDTNFSASYRLEDNTKQCAVYYINQY